MKKNKPLITDDQIDELIHSFNIDEEDVEVSPSEDVEETVNNTVSVSETVDKNNTEPDILPLSQTNSNVLEQAPKTESVDIEFSSESAQKPEKKSAASAKSGNAVKLCAIMVMLVLLMWLLPSGNVMNLASASNSTKDRDTFFEVSSLNLMGNALSEIYAMPRRYVLELSDILTPAPDQANFAKIEDDERKNYDGTPIYYYKDETIEVKCWKEKITGCIYNFSEVWIADASQLRRALVDNVISKKHMDFPQNIFNKTNGVVGMSADYCAFRPYGIVIQYGNVIRNTTSNRLDIAIYDKMGNFSTGKDNDAFFESEIFKSGDIIHTFAFGPTLVDDYKVSKSHKLIADPWEQPGEMKDNYPRAAICQFDYDKHYLLCTVNYRGVTAKDFAQALQEKGVRYAYNLDGGQTATLLFNRDIINTVAYGGPRQMSDILYFATAVPEKSSTERK